MVLRYTRRSMMRRNNASAGRAGDPAGCTHRTGSGFVRPAVWVSSRCIVGWTTPGARRYSTYSSIGAARSSTPSSARRIAAVAVTSFDIENHRNEVEATTGRLRSMSANP